MKGKDNSSLGIKLEQGKVCYGNTAHLNGFLTMFKQASGCASSASFGIAGSVNAAKRRTTAIVIRRERY
jgi:hypothetical protein